MIHNLIRSRLFNTGLRTTMRVAIAAAIAALSIFSVSAQVVIYQEGFNTDGEAATPKRYTTVGREVFELARQPELQLPAGSEQAGPVYWAHNFDVSFAGVPFPPRPDA